MNGDERTSITWQSSEGIFLFMCLEGMNVDGWISDERNSRENKRARGMRGIINAMSMARIERNSCSA